MTKIRPLKPSDMKEVRVMIEYIKPGISSIRLSEEYFIMFPLDLVHSFLPLNMKFLQESYVAIENKEILGLISIIPDNKDKTRWKINRLILNNNSYDVGKKLVDYVVNKYGGAGVETFITNIDSNYPEAISLFKNSCSFRNCSQIQILAKNVSEIEYLPSNDYKFLRKIKYSDARYLSELDHQALYPHFRPSLIKSAADFKFGLKNRILNKLRGYKVKRLVLESPAKKSIEAYILIMSMDGINYRVDIILSLAYQEHYTDLLSDVSRYVKSQNENAKLFIYLRKYYQSSKKFAEVLKTLGFKENYLYQVLVKDYWKLTPVESDKKVPIVIFPDITSPACNILNLL